MALAPKAPFAAPTIDRLSVRVVVDSAYDLFPLKQEHAAVRVEQFGRAPNRQMSTLACEWGLSLHLLSERAGRAAEYLLDFGYTPEIINRNFHLLDIDVRKIEGLILSHAHRDHYGGMEGFIEQHRSHMPPEIALFVGGEEAFREKWLGEPANPMSWGVVDRVMLRAHQVMPACCSEPHDLGQAFTTGYIPRTSFETVSGGSMVLPEWQAYNHFTDAELAGKLVKDLHPDEHATCYVLQGKGLIVISSCGHVGLINTIKAAMAVSRVSKVHAVIGGFHLGPAALDYIEHTIDELAVLDPDVVLPLHCSGANFIAAMRRRLPDKLVTSNVGARFTFAA